MIIKNLFKNNQKKEMNVEKAKKILEEYNYSFMAMDRVKGVYDEYMSCNIPMEMMQQWYKGAFEKRKEAFKKSCEDGTPDLDKLYFICQCVNVFDKNIIRDSYDIVVSNAEKMGPINEIVCYGVIANDLFFNGIARTVGQENFEFILGGIKERLGNLFQTNAELQQKYQALYNNCESALSSSKKM